MQEILRIVLTGMQQDMERMNNVAINLANVGTPGYRQEVVAMRPFGALLDDAGPTGVIPSQGGDSELAMGLLGMQVRLDTRTGTIKQTGEPLDVALTGDGFFEVTTETGPAYTRQGNFRIDARGRLITAQGYPVMGNNGEIYLTTRTPVIDGSGNITEPNATSGPSATTPGQPGQPVAQIKIVRFANPATMQRSETGLMAPGTDMTVVNQMGDQLRQGALENANVNQIPQMLQMLQIVRHLESMQKLTQNYDDMLGTAIHKLGELS
jgi:flagellar basal-body rod protein FlgF